MKYLKAYNIFESGPDDPRSIPITADIKATIMDSFRGLEDMIDIDSPQFGVKIGRPKNRDVERRGISKNSICINILPDLHNGVDQKEHKQYPELSYTPSKTNDEFYDELIGSIYQCSGFNEIEIQGCVVAYSNGGEDRGPGEKLKMFTKDGSDQYGQLDKLPKVDELESFLKEIVKDRLRWIKIFFDRPEQDEKFIK